MTIQFATLTQALTERREDGRAVTFIEGAELESRLGFDQLYDRALGVLGALQSRGVRPGERIILAPADNQQFLESFWACLLGGIIPVPLAVGATREHRAKVFRIHDKLGEPRLLTDQSRLERLQKYAEEAGLLATYDALAANALLSEDLESDRPGEVHEPKPDDLALIQFSSGSTRAPKGIQLTHRNLLVNTIDMGERERYTDDDVALNWMPLTHDMGLIAFHLTFVVFGMDHHMMPTELFSRRPLLWLSKAAEKRASVLGSPNFGYKHYLRAYRAKGVRDDLDLSAVRLIMNGAEPISVPLCFEFLDTMEPHGLARSALQTVYGLAEASVGVSIPHPGSVFEYLTLDRSSLQVGSPVVLLEPGDSNGVYFPIEGPPFQHCEVRFVDDQGEPVGPDHVGHLQIRGPNVTSGYLEDTQANHQAFTEDGWLDTGDLGLEHQGQVVVTGRAKDIIFAHGQNAYPQDLEAAAQSVAQIELGKVAAAGWRPPNAEADEVLVFVLFRGRLEDFVAIASEVAGRVNEHTGVEVNQVIPVKRIPKTTSGKVQRHELLAAYQRGDFEPQIQQLTALTNRAQADAASPASVLLAMETTLLEISAKVLPERQIGISDNLFEIGISSLDLAQIHEKLDELYPGLVDIMDLFDHPTFGELAVFVEQRITAAAAS